MRGCTQILAGVLAALFVITVTFTLFTVSFAQIITDRAAIKAILPKPALSDDVVPALISEVAREQARLLNAPLADVEPIVLRTVIHEVLPPGWVATQVDAVVDALFDFLTVGNQTPATLEIDAGTILNRLRGEPGRQAILVALQQLPQCTGAQLGFSFETGYFEEACVPPDAPLSDIATRVHSTVVDTLAQSPEVPAQIEPLTVPVLDENMLPPAARARLNQLRLIFALIQDRAWMLWLIPLSALLLMTLVAVRSFNDLSYWWGWSFLVAGFIALFLAIFTPPLLTATALRTITATSETLRIALSQLAQQALDALLDQWMSDVYRQAGLMSVGGVGLLLAGFIRRTTSSTARSGLP